LETAAAVYNSISVDPDTMTDAIGRLVNGKFRATVLLPRVESLEVEAGSSGPMEDELLDRLRKKIGVRSVAVHRTGFIQISCDRYPIVPVHHWCWCWRCIFERSEVVFVRSSKMM
jgi:hypothetical protein